MIKMTVFEIYIFSLGKRRCVSLLVRPKFYSSIVGEALALQVDAWQKLWDMPPSLPWPRGSEKEGWDKHSLGER